MDVAGSRLPLWVMVVALSAPLAAGLGIPAQPPGAQAGPGASSHCDVIGTILVPQGQKAAAATHLGAGALNGVVNYRITCVHPDKPFSLRYLNPPLGGGFCEVADFDILFWPAGTVVTPLRAHRACGNDAGTVPFGAAFADVLLIAGAPGATFQYVES